MEIKSSEESIEDYSEQSKIQIHTNGKIRHLLKFTMDDF